MHYNAFSAQEPPVDKDKFISPEAKQIYPPAEQILSGFMIYTAQTNHRRS